MRYTKVIRSEDGGSAFEDCEIPLETLHVAEGTPPMAVGGLPSAGGGPGDLVLVADTTGTGHVTAGVGDPPLEGLFIPVTGTTAR